jgi:V/A-type H+-transporting ATPase subunit B
VPPIDVLPSFRAKDKESATEVKEEHSGTMNQLFAAYVGRQGRGELMSILVRRPLRIR